MASERREPPERGALALGSSCAGGASPRLTLPDGLTSQSQESQLVLAAADSSASWSDSSAVGADGSDRTTSSKKGSSKPQTERRRRQRINQCVGLLKNLVLEAMGKDPSQYTKLEKADVLDMAVRYVQTLRDQQQKQQQQQQMQQQQMLQQPPEETTATQSTKNVFPAAQEAPIETAGVPPASLNVPLTNQRLSDNSLFLYNPGNVTGNLNGNLSHPQPTSPQYHAGFSQCSSEIELYLRMLKNVPGDLPDKVASHLNNLLSKIKAESTETLVSKEPPKITSISPSIQPILLLLNPISTTPVQTVQMVGPVASESPVHITSNIVTTPPLQNKPHINLSNFNEKLPPESLPLHSHANQFDISSPSTSTLGGLSLSSSKSAEGAMTPDRSPCHSVMSDKSSVGYFYFSDDTDRAASPETVTMYRCDDSFATDNVYSEPQNETPTPGTSTSFSLLRSSQKSAPFARDKQFMGQSSVSSQSEDCGQPSSSSSQQYNSISFDKGSRKSHSEVLQSRSLQEGELSTMWRPWHS